MERIRQNQSTKSTKRAGKVRQKDYQEPLEVTQKEKELKMNVTVPKVGIGFKFDRNAIPLKRDELVDMYLTMFATLTFGISSKFREDARNKKWMTSFYTQWEQADHHKDFLIMAESTVPEELLKQIKLQVEHINIEEEEVERIKKVWISSEVQMIDIVETTVDNIVDDLIKYKKILPNKIELIRSLNKKDLDRVIQELDFSNWASVIVYPQEKNDNTEDKITGVE